MTLKISYEFNSCLRTFHGGYSLKDFLNLWEAFFTIASTLFSYKKAISARRHCVSSYEFNSGLHSEPCQLAAAGMGSACQCALRLLPKQHLLSRLLSFSLSICGLLSTSAFAGELIRFDNDYLIAYRSSGETQAYYGASNNRTGFSCVFFFKTLASSQEANRSKKVISFYTQSSFAQRDKKSDVAGVLHETSSSWVIQLDENHGGCTAGVGWDATLSPKDDQVTRFEVIRTTPSIGLLTATKKTYLYTRVKGNLVPTKAFITQNDLFSVLKKSGDFSYGQHVNIETSNVVDSATVTSGWIRSADLISPF